MLSLRVNRVNSSLSLQYITRNCTLVDIFCSQNRNLEKLPVSNLSSKTQLTERHTSVHTYTGTQTSLLGLHFQLIIYLMEQFGSENVIFIGLF